MSIIDVARRAAAPKALSPGDVLKELHTAQAALADLESQHGAAALDAMAHEAGAERRLEDLNRQLVGARERVRTLAAAHRAAIEREEAATMAQRAAIQASQRKAAIGHLRARDAAAAALSDHLEKAAEQYRILLERSEKAQAACPAMTQWPDGSLCTHSALRRLVENELYRLSAEPGNKEGRALPGAAPSSSNTEWNPKAIKPLAEQTKQASAFVIGKLTGKQPE